MDPGCKKDYTFHEVHSQNLYDDYYSAHVPYSVFRDTAGNMIKAIHKAFSTGKVKGKTVTDFSIGPIIHQLFPMNDCVEEITTVKVNDGSLKGAEKWKNKEPDALDWSHAWEFYKELKGNSNKSECEEEKLRGKVKVLKWNVGKDNPAESLSLPKADIVTSIVLLETISKTHEDFRRNLRTFYNLINPGGYLLLYAVVNGSYFKIGEHKFHFLSCDESFYRKALCGEGFEIDHCENVSTVMISDILDYEGVVFIIAHKVKEP